MESLTQKRPKGLQTQVIWDFTKESALPGISRLLVVLVLPTTQFGPGSTRGHRGLGLYGRLRV